MKDGHGIIQMVCLRQHTVLCKSTGQKQIFILVFDTCTCSGFSKKKKKVVILFECHVAIFWYPHWPQNKIVNTLKALYIYRWYQKAHHYSVSWICLIQVFMIFVFPLSLSTWIENDKWKNDLRADPFYKKYRPKFGKLGVTTNKLYFILPVNISIFSFI